jgi:hypothetical protein
MLANFAECMVRQLEKDNHVVLQASFLCSRILLCIVRPKGVPGLLNNLGPALTSVICIRSQATLNEGSVQLIYAVLPHPLGCVQSWTLVSAPLVLRLIC